MSGRPWVGTLTPDEVAAGAAEVRAGRPWMHIAAVPHGARRGQHPDVLAMLRALGKGWAAYMANASVVAMIGAEDHFCVQYYETAKGVPVSMKPEGHV